MPPIEALHGAHEPRVALLDEIEHRCAPVGKASRDRHHQAQIARDHLLARPRLVALHALRQLNFLTRGKPRETANLAQIGPQAHHLFQLGDAPYSSTLGGHCGVSALPLGASQILDD